MMTQKYFISTITAPHGIFTKVPPELKDRNNILLKFGIEKPNTINVTVMFDDSALLESEAMLYSLQKTELLALELVLKNILNIAWNPNCKSSWTIETGKIVTLVPITGRASIARAIDVPPDIHYVKEELIDAVTFLIAPTCQAPPGAGMGARPSRRAGAELDQVSGRPDAGKDRLMPKVLDNVIVAAMPDPSDYTVALTWANGETTINSFRERVGRGVLAALPDPAVFAQVRVGERGRSIEWPGDIDFCADALWFEAHPAEAPQSPRPPAGQAHHTTAP